MLLEKTCSRCAQVSWSNQGGGSGRVCPVDGKACDMDGSLYVDGEIHIGRLEF